MIDFVIDDEIGSLIVPGVSGTLKQPPKASFTTRWIAVVTVWILHLHSALCVE